MIYGHNYSTAISSIIPYHLSPLLDIALVGLLPFSGSQKNSHSETSCHGLFLLLCIAVFSFRAHIESIHCLCLAGFCCSVSIKGILKYLFRVAFGLLSCLLYNSIISDWHFLLFLSINLFSTSWCRCSFLFCHLFNAQKIMFFMRCLVHHVPVYQISSFSHRCIFYILPPVFFPIVC